MDLEEFPSCCGIDIITGLYGIVDNAVWDSEKQEYRSWRKTDTIKLIEEYLLDTKANKRGIVLAVTNRDPRQKRSAALLQEFGFTKLYSFYNPRHRSQLTMWHLEMGTLTQAKIKTLTKKLVKKYDRTK
ncbi:MAG TPA: hypothetical protein VI146_08550 [Nitrososphaeraceae archaeon]